VADRRLLLNGNSFRLGVSGSGKSMSAKEEIVQIALATEDDILILDPESEFGHLTRALGGEVIQISAASDTHINALDMDKEYGDDRNPIIAKSEFVLSLFEQLAGSLTAAEKSILGRCTELLYKPYLDRGCTGTPPTLKDFYRLLKMQPETEAQGLALSSELFITGTLNTFARHTNVNTRARIIDYDIRELGESSITVQQAVEQLTGEYRDELEHISDTVPHDRQEIEANDDVYYIRWQDVLAVFSSRVSGAEDGAPVAALDETRLDELREILWDMNEVSYTTREETVEVPAQNANTEASRDTASESTANDSGAESQESNEADTTTITQTVLTIHLTHKTPEEMQTAYNFTARQAEYLPLLQDPEYETLWAELLGGFAAGSSEILMPDTTHTPTGTLQWPLPIPGSITSPFGYRTDPLTGETSYHDGTDIAVPESTPILADADGTVTVANALDSWGGSYGYYVQIDHSSGLQTLYAHCSQICVTQGQQVQAGQVIAYVGHTGRATGNHLHFEVRENGERVDAMSYYQ
jgi:murein DD-endopeptidase MepM/ murein hydrolase activator NlpD